MHKLIIISVIVSVVFSGIFVWLIMNERCNVATIFLSGQLTTDSAGWIQKDGTDVYHVASKRLTREIDDTAEKAHIKALIFDVNSEGGSVVAAEEIFNAITKLEIPTVTLVRDGAFSAAYTAISGTDKIFLSNSSQVGAIGVTGSYLQKYEKNLKEGIVFQELTSAKFKDLLNPNKQLTKEEKELIQKVIDDLHENVVRTIAEGRNMSISDIETLADGSIYVGEKAIEKNLADEIGGVNEIEEYLQTVVGKKIKVCVAK